MEMKKNIKAESWKLSAVKGAVIWGSVYSSVFVGSAYWLAPTGSGSIAPLPELLKNALVVFPFAGAFRGVLMWRLWNGYNVFRFGRKKGA